MHRPRRLAAILAAITIAAVAAGTLWPAPAHGQERPSLWWGRSGPDVVLVQDTLRAWGYYNGPIDGYYGWSTIQAVIRFQSNNGLTPDGVVGPSTWAALGYPSAPPPARYWSGPVVSYGDDVNLLARVITGEASGEPYAGQVAVGAVILNRVRHPSFPKTLAGVIYEPYAFESVTNGLIWSRPPLDSAYRAAADAINGWDPTYGAIYFWNPSKPVSPWVWTRQIITYIGNHVFAR